MRNLSWDEKLFLFLLVLFLATGILGLYGPAYWERSGDRYMFSKYWVVQLIFMVVAGVAIFHYMPRILLRFWQSLNSWRKIVLVVGVVFLIFIFTMGIFKFINVSVGRVKIPVKGYVYRKWKVRHRKSTDYYLIVRDTVNRKQYEFEVRRQVYELAGNPGDAYSNTFYRGCFGVVYRHNIW